MRMTLSVFATTCLATSLLISETSSLARSVESKDRELLLVSELQTHANQSYRWLYRFIEANSVSMAQKHLGGSYRQIWLLAGQDATKWLFQNALSTLTANPNLKALDVFLHLHGAPGALYFAEGPYTSAKIKEDLKDDASPNRYKLRTLYSTACYGSSHAQDFLDAGFQVASGAVAVNTNAAYDYPTTMDYWRRGWDFGVAQEQGNHSFWRNTFDLLAGKKGFGQANSYKHVYGDASLTINETR